MEGLLFWVGVALVLCTITLVVAATVTVASARRIEPNEKLQSQVRALDADLADLVDHVNRKETRERVRKMRDGREAAQQPVQAPATPAEEKQLLRAVARERGLVR